MTVVVSDTSPLRALAYVGHLDWLEQLFGQVLVPPAVAHELEFPPDRFSPLRVAQIPFLVIAAPRDQGRVSQWRKTLDPGEAEALALAEELHAEIVLIDESVGRQRSAATVPKFHSRGEGSSGVSNVSRQLR